MTGLLDEKLKRSRNPSAVRAGPRVIRRKRSEGGYLLVFRKERKVKSAED